MMEISVEKLSEDQRDFAEKFYMKHKGLMRSVICSYYGGKDECEDILHDSVIKLMRNVRKLQNMDELAVLQYISTTVKHTALNYLRTQNSKLSSATFYAGPDELSDIIGKTIDSATPEEVLLKNEERKRMLEVIGSLPEKYRIFLIGKYYLEMENKTLANIAGCSESSVRAYLTRARQALLKELEEEE